MFEIKELTIEEIDIIKSFFKDVFMREPWNDDWSDNEQLHQYITDIIGNQNSLPGPLQGELCWIKLVGHQVHCSLMSDMQVCISRNLLTPLTF